MTNRDKINAVISQYGIIIDAEIKGLRVTQYRATLTHSAPVNKLMKLETALSIALNDDSVVVSREGNQFIIEIAEGNGIVNLSSLLNDKFKAAKGMTVALGKAINGDNLYTDLSRQPHMLVAGTTGGGKSMFLHSVIESLFFKQPNTEIFAIDGKGSEFAVYQDIPRFHYIKDIPNTLHTLRWLCGEMDRRYDIFAQNGWRDIDSAWANGRKLIKIVCIVDELADLMLQSKEIKSEIEDCIVRLAQKSRAAGIHLVLATQRPTSDVLTGLIKANIPCRVCFRVTSALESRIVLDRNGAEKLLNNGDMLFLGKGNMNTIRVQACYISEADMKQAASNIASVLKPAQPQPEVTRTTVQNNAPRNIWGAFKQAFAR